MSSWEEHTFDTPESFQPSRVQELSFGVRVGVEDNSNKCRKCGLLTSISKPICESCG